MAMVGFLQKISQYRADLFDQRLDWHSGAESLRGNYQCDPRCHGKRRSFTRLQEELDCGRWEAQLVQPRIALDCRNMLVSVVSVRPPAARCRNEALGDQVSNLPFCN